MQAATPAVTLTFLPWSEAALPAASPFLVFTSHHIGGDMHYNERLLVEYVIDLNLASVLFQ